jgi:hypothetical protein
MSVINEPPQIVRRKYQLTLGTDQFEIERQDQQIRMAGCFSKRGISDLVDRTCRHALTLARGLSVAGYDILNDVVMNQVLISFGDDDTTRRVIDAVQLEGTCWCGGTLWKGRKAMRISVSCWATRESDIEKSLDAILRVASDVRSRG